MSATDKKTIMVVDDEPEVRKLVGAMVSNFGYTVLTADSGEHALTLYKNNHPLELLITDVIAPGMSGPMLADKLTEMQPDLKVLYISGYTDDEVVQRGISGREVAFLRKPFASEELVRRVRGVLDAAPV
jgi:two-component system, cell cycle sensor histidine kinase and response regulator CckA